MVPPIRVEATLATISEQIKSLSSTIADLRREQTDARSEFDALRCIVLGNGKIGLVDDVRDMRRDFKQLVRVLTYIASSLVAIAGLIAAPLVSEVVASIYHSTIPVIETVKASEESRLKVLPTPTSRPAATPTHTPAPATTLTPASPHTAIPYHSSLEPGPVPTPSPMVITEKEHRALAALCWVECRGMLEQRSACCLSVIDTVMTRIRRGLITDGTVIGTIQYGCGPTTLECQFPAYVTRGCTGIVAPCPFDDVSSMRFFASVVFLYVTNGAEPACAGYLYYGLQDFDTPTCVITSDGGFLNFHNGYNRH